MPAAAGFYRFNIIGEAASCIDTIGHYYEKNSRLARRLAEEYFSAKAIARNVMEDSLGWFQDQLRPVRTNTAGTSKCISRVP